MTFEFYPLRFEFIARDSVHFPAGKPGNIIRGAFGCIFKSLACVASCGPAQDCQSRESCPYARIFEPVCGDGPSGLADPPRPFVFRASHLDAQTLAPGRPFHFDVHLFDVHLFNVHQPALPFFVSAFAQLATEGLGPRRGRAELVAVSRIGDGPFLVSEPPRVMSVSLEPDEAEVRTAVVQFRTPTELKAGGKLVEKPEFGVLFARIRDRVSLLRSAYGAGPLAIDYRAMGERAERVRMTRCELRRVEAERRSGRTGQTHSLGGFVGECGYEGELREFLPYLRAAKWTGVGRQTVWGKGEIEVSY
ncbi:MAG: CRISPR system precrRNA processing endoribonuclease RAMP protein Cas6 [Acidobacteriota bacterium]|nr:CRISPR system precrRNA processing endoribonuclease RAMP protein Cas6 [Acidobacteriota bacterium]